MLLRVVVVLTNLGHFYSSVGVMWLLYVSVCLTGVGFK